MTNGRLERWFVAGDVIIGEVYGHPSHLDGKVIRTSRVARLDIENNLVITQNSSYILGQPFTEEEEV